MAEFFWTKISLFTNSTEIWNKKRSFPNKSDFFENELLGTGLILAFNCTLSSTLLSMSINDRVDNKNAASSVSSTISFGHGKMPVSALQEHLQKRGEPIPVYSESHGGPPFTVTVKCGDLCVEHSGASKKDAKHKAAEAMLMKLSKTVSPNTSKMDSFASINTNSSSTASNLSHLSTNSLSSIDPQGISNPVGFLQEQMQRHGFQMPEYRTTEPTTSHPFTQTVVLPSFNISVAGHGVKKNEAKRQAAKAMIGMLKDNDFPRSAISSLGTSVS